MELVRLHARPKAEPDRGGKKSGHTRKRAATVSRRGEKRLLGCAAHNRGRPKALVPPWRRPPLVFTPWRGTTRTGSDVLGAGLAQVAGPGCRPRLPDALRPWRGLRPVSLSPNDAEVDPA